MDLKDNETLNDDEYNVLHQQYKQLFEEELEFLTSSDIFVQYKNKFVADICNYLSKDFILDDKDRIAIALWLIRSKSQQPTLDDIDLITESLLCLWRYEPLFQSLLQLMTECCNILPLSIDAMLFTIDSKTEVLIESDEMSENCDVSLELDQHHENDNLSHIVDENTEKLMGKNVDKESFHWSSNFK